MRIALDARTIYRTPRRGTGKNLVDLYTHLARLRPDWRVNAYHRESHNDASILPLPQVQPQRIEMVGDRFDAWERFRLPMASWRDGADVLHCPANTCPDFLPARTIVTIHDLIPLDQPQDTTSHDARRFENCVRLACKDATRIICPSHYTHDRLVNEFGASTSKITVNHWAPDAAMHHASASECQQIAEYYDLTKPFVLHLGAAAPRKNTRRVLEAWAGLPRKLRESWQLLIVGLDDKASATAGKLCERWRLGESVRLYGFAPECDMPALFTAASLLAYPSLSEGFGLPILDAWIAGCPVLSSNTTSIPEVAGDAAILVDPLDAPAITRGMRRAMENPEIRADLSHRGSRRVRQFTWQATTQRFVEAVESAAGIINTPLRRAA